MSDSFSQLNQKIQTCELCSAFIKPLKKTSVVNRGGVCSVLIIGRNPGNTELESTKPFSGLSGQRLDSWLKGCGNPQDNPRKNIYLTSIIKCFCDDSKKKFKKMSQNCAKILNEQIALVKPQLVITLGEDSFNSLKFTNENFSEAVFKVYDSRSQNQNSFFPKWEHHFYHLVWPHPSPLSRVLNEEENKKQLEETFEIVKKHLGEN